MTKNPSNIVYNQYAANKLIKDILEKQIKPSYWPNLSGRLLYYYCCTIKHPNNFGIERTASVIHVTLHAKLTMSDLQRYPKKLSLMKYE